MFTRWSSLIFTAFVFTAVPVSNFAQADFNRGLEAYNLGDYQTALREWLIDANQGDSAAQNNVGTMYAYGLGVPTNYAEAAYWYRLAADQGNTDAQQALGWHYINGEGVPQEYAEAMRWYHLAANQGHVGAQIDLGSIYYNGRGVLENYIAAYMWYNLAAAQGDKGASEAKEALREGMTNAQISEAQRLSTEWLKEHP